MTDDLKERLRETDPTFGGRWHYMDPKSVTAYGPWVRWRDHEIIIAEKDVRITELEARLAAAEDKLTEWQSSQSYRYIGRDGKPVLARDLEARAEAAEAEVQRCHERLEITHVWRMKPGAGDLDDLERIDVPMEERASVPDAITCRDATIALLEEDIEDLRAARDAAEAGEDALAEAARRLRKHSETQMRTADYHGEECKCWRCSEDALFAALAAYEARRKG